MGSEFHSAQIPLTPPEHPVLGQDLPSPRQNLERGAAPSPQSDAPAAAAEEHDADQG